MLKLGLKVIFTLIAVFTLFTCIDPYTPKLTGYESLLVVDGLITDANSSYSIKLTRTFQDVNSIPLNVSDATVSVSDDAGNINILSYSGNGVYKSDSTTFRGTVGRTYVLHITTPKEEDFASEPCLMQSVPDIDSIYFEKDAELVNNNTESQQGVMVYLNSKGSDNNRFYRWTFDETWKFKVPTPSKFIFIDSATFLPVDRIREYCWKSSKSDKIIIRSIYTGESTRLDKQPIYFIASDKSDRLMVQYNTLIKQYSISKKEYDFWNELKKINELGGDIFARQPYAVISNVHNVNNPKQRILGYFQVSGMKQKRIDLPFSQFVAMNLPFYHTTCERFERDPWELPIPGTWKKLYSIWCITSNYAFVEPKLIPGSLVCVKLVFTTKECANCELTGTSKKPDFWTDLN
jgi:hypothetical protein